jgi:hypothetical protein
MFRLIAVTTPSLVHMGTIMMVLNDGLISRFDLGGSFDLSEGIAAFLGL